MEEEIREPIHPGIDKVSNFVDLKNSQNISSLYKKGYIYLDSLISVEKCNLLINDLEPIIIS